jgi:hypothetical protein
MSSVNQSSKDPYRSITSSALRIAVIPRIMPLWREMNKGKPAHTCVTHQAMDCTCHYSTRAYSMIDIEENKAAGKLELLLKDIMDVVRSDVM